MLWNPLIQASGTSFGVQSSQFGFNITGTTNIPIVVEACTNLANPQWTPVPDPHVEQRFILLQRTLADEQPRTLLPHQFAVTATAVPEQDTLSLLGLSSLLWVSWFIGSPYILTFSPWEKERQSYASGIANVCPANPVALLWWSCGVPGECADNGQWGRAARDAPPGNRDDRAPRTSPRGRKNGSRSKRIALARGVEPIIAQRS